MGDHEIYNFSYSYPTDATYYKFGKDWPRASKEEDIKEGARRTPTHNNMSPELERLRWPSEEKVIGYLLSNRYVLPNTVALFMLTFNVFSLNGAIVKFYH